MRCRCGVGFSFFAELERIAAEGYLPSTKDILHMRVRTTGIVEGSFWVSEGVRIKVVDVGGQRAERRKWSVVDFLLRSLLCYCASTEKERESLMVSFCGYLVQGPLL